MPGIVLGLLPTGKSPVRGGALLFESDEGWAPVGAVTSGGYGPTIGRPIAMGYVETRFANAQTTLFADVRGARLAVTVSPTPFVQHRYKCG